MSSTYIPTSMRRLVWERARGRCEYCGLPVSVAFFSHEADHVIAEKHGGSTDVGNLALACFDCNRFKGSDLTSIDPDSGAIVPLFNPRTQIWDDHFAVEGGRIVPLTATGRASERLLRLNMLERVEVRAMLAEVGEWP